MIVHLLILSSFIGSSIQRGEIIDLPNNGGKAITGRGCGISMAIKVLKKVPNNPSHFECAVIPSDQSQLLRNSHLAQGIF